MASDDIPESEIFMINELNEFRIRLHNLKGESEIINYEERVKNYRHGE